MSGIRNGSAPMRAMDNDSDVEEEALVADYKEQVQYEDADDADSLTMAQQADDIQSRLVAAAQPLDFSAPLDVKFQSYDNYCNLFHFILNSDGPVDLEPPSVSTYLPTYHYLSLPCHSLSLPVTYHLICINLDTRGVEKRKKKGKNVKADNISNFYLLHSTTGRGMLSTSLSTSSTRSRPTD